jgi:hypothetical protein
MSTSSETLQAVAAAPVPISVNAVMRRLCKDRKRSTVARALRRMRAKGLVTSYRAGRLVLWENKVQPTKVSVNKQQAKGPARSNIMCRPDNMPTLCKAIDEQVALFITDKKEFSAFDVTKVLREKVAQAAINKTDSGIDDGETGTVFVSGVSVAKIDHDIVKEAVHDIFQRGEMVGFDRDFNSSKGHWLYGEAIDVPITTDDDDDVDSVDPVGAVPASPGTTSGTSYDGSSSL